jgi:two-component system, NtrC family, sensor kinase
MRLTSSPATWRIILGFSAVLAIFGGAALVSMQTFQRIIDSTDEILELQRGRENGLQIEVYARRMEAVMADLARSADIGQIPDFDEATMSFENLELQMTAARRRLTRLARTSQEKQWMAQCEDWAWQIDFEFRYHLLPAVASRNEDLAWQYRQHARDMLESLIWANRRMTTAQEMQIRRARDSALRLRDAAERDTAILLSVAVLAAIIIGYWAVHSIISPIRELMKATESLAGGDWTPKVDSKRQDEFGRLAESFNRMSEDLRTHQQKLVQAEKMASLGRMSAGVAHEINNPIGVILGYVKLLLKNEALTGQVRSDVQVIGEEAEQCQQIVQDLLSFSRPIPPAHEVVDLCKVVEECLSRASRSYLPNGVAIVRDYRTDTLPVRGDGGRIAQAIQNIVRNGLEAMKEGGALTATLRIVEHSEAVGKELRTRPMAEVLLADTGPGIPPENLGKVFEPFFTTKDKGTGLGLPIAYAAIRAYSGSITIQSEKGHGTRFTIRLPLIEELVT